MHPELAVLKSYVSMVLMVPTNPPTPLVSKMTIECERLKVCMLLLFNKSGQTDHTMEMLNGYRYTTIQLANSLTNAANPSDKVVSETLTIVIDLIGHTEKEHGHLLDKTHELPVFVVEGLHQKLGIELQEIRERLEQKKVSAPLLKQLIKAHLDLFRTKKFPKPCYADSQYLNIFIPQLKHLAMDDREKDWNRRLLLLLIKFNFNHMGIYKLFMAEQRKSASLIKDSDKLNQFIFELKSWLESIQVIPVLAYNPYADPLKDLLLKHIQTLEVYFKEKLENAKWNQNKKINLAISVDDLALYFHYYYGEGIYNYNYKTDAADAFSKHIRTKGTDQISPRSILKLDRIAHYTAAVRFSEQLQRIQNQLGKDFGL